MTRKRPRPPTPLPPGRRDRVLVLLLCVCLVGVTGSLAGLALYADRLVTVRGPIR